MVFAYIDNNLFLQLNLLKSKVHFHSEFRRINEYLKPVLITSNIMLNVNMNPNSRKKVQHGGRCFYDVE